jgi:hypothetical protein
MHHWQLLIRRLLTLRYRNAGRQQSHENREKPFHFFSPQSRISTAIR